MDVAFRRTWLRALIVTLFVLCAGGGAYAVDAGATRATDTRATRSSDSPTSLSIAWQSPRDGTTVRGVLSGSTCDVAVRDASPITKVTFGIDGSTFRTDTTPPYTCDLSAPALSPGMHILDARAYDAAGSDLSSYIYVSTPWSGRPRISVTVQGDSLTAGSWWRIPAYLGPDYDFASFSAHWGRPSVEALSLLRRQRLGRVVVFALGTNDHWWPPSVYRQHLMSVLQLIGSSRCLVVATIWRQGPDRARNDVLYSLARQYGPARIQLARWAEAVGSGKVRLSPDGTHPDTQAAWDARAAIIASAIRACAAQ